MNHCLQELAAPAVAFYGQCPPLRAYQGLPNVAGLGELNLLGRFLFIAFQARISRTCELRLEFFNPALGVDEFLFPRVERVAGTTDIDLQFFARAPGLKRITTAAFDVGLKIFGMDIFFHRFACFR